MVSYWHKLKGTASDHRKWGAITKRSALSGWTQERYVARMREKGLSMSTAKLREDWRKARATEHAKGKLNRLKAEKWFDIVFEPFRKEHGITGRQAGKLWQKRAEDSARTRAEDNLVSELDEKYRLLMDFLVQEGIVRKVGGGWENVR